MKVSGVGSRNIPGLRLETTALTVVAADTQGGWEEAST